MRIKSIRPTNKYAEIPFKTIIDDCDNKHVLTPDGFKPVLACEFIKRDKTLKIKTQAGELICHTHHKLMVNDNNRITEKFACDLLSTDKLIGYFNKLLDFTVEDGDIENLYDIQLPDPHWWYTSGIVSHNSVLLCNTAISSLKGEGPNGTIGQDVLLITFELDNTKTAMRCLASTVNIPQDDLANHQEHITRIVTAMQKQYDKRFAIFEMSPDECSVNNIYALIDNLKRTENWKPDVLILDYMDLMISRNPSYNTDDYTRQKHVSNEIRGLAKNENLLIFTATQTNRSGASGEEIADLKSAAESFGKQFALDYIVSLNQTKSDRQANPPRLKMFIAKNRNGPKHVLIPCEIHYDTMIVKEEL